MAMDENRPLPYKGGGSELDRVIYEFEPDRYNHCATTRSRMKYRRIAFKERILKAIEDERSNGKAAVQANGEGTGTE